MMACGVKELHSLALEVLHSGVRSQQPAAVQVVRESAGTVEAIRFAEAKEGHVLHPAPDLGVIGENEVFLDKVLHANAAPPLVEDVPAQPRQ